MQIYNLYGRIYTVMNNEEKVKQKEVVYTAMFVDNVEKLKEKYPPVHKNIYYHHSTIAFQPKEGIRGIDIGKKHILKITGRATTDRVDALLVKNNKSMNKYPHITLSTAEGVKPVASNEEIEKAIKNNSIVKIQDEVETTEGYFDGKSVII